MLKPVLVGQFEFVQWTPDGHLRDSQFMGLREDKEPRDQRAPQITSGDITNMTARTHSAGTVRTRITIRCKVGLLAGENLYRPQLPCSQKSCLPGPGILARAPLPDGNGH
jgi:hypothetical protein